VGEDDRFAIRRPIKATAKTAAHVEIALGELSRLAFSAGIFLHRNHPQPVHLEILVHDLGIVLAFVGFLFSFGWWVGHGIGDYLPIRRPFKTAHLALALGQLLSFAAVGADEPKIILSRPAGRERDPASVGRPLRVGARFVAEGELKRIRAVSVGHVDVRQVFAFLGGHHRLVHRVDHTLPVRRYLHASHDLHFHLLVRRPLSGCRRCQGQHHEENQDTPSPRSLLH